MNLSAKMCCNEINHSRKIRDDYKNDFLTQNFLSYGFPLQMASYFGYTVAVSDVNNDG